MLSSPSHRLPMRVLPLINGACQGARRVYNYTRPHTFQVQVGTITLHLAAPDEYVASEWLQALVHAASKVSRITTVLFLLFIMHLKRSQYYFIFKFLIHKMAKI